MAKCFMSYWKLVIQGVSDNKDDLSHFAEFALSPQKMTKFFAKLWRWACKISHHFCSLSCYC